MIRELRRFDVRDAGGTMHTVVEVATLDVGTRGRESLRGKPTLLTYAGAEIFPTSRPGEYIIERTGALLLEVG